jgi:hypothetical protein
MKKNVIIIGCDISALYAGVIYLKNGYNVTIIERNKDICKNDCKYYYDNCRLYDSSHTTYIKLLKQLGIHGKIVKKIKYNEILFPILIKMKSFLKKVPSCFFDNICAYYVVQKYLTYKEVKYLENIHLKDLLNNINIFDFLNIFLTFFAKQNTTYFLNSNSVSMVEKRLLEQFKKKNGKVIFNENVEIIQHLNDKFYINNTYYCDILFTAISKHNLLKFNIWRDYHKLLFNSICELDSNMIHTMLKSNIDFQVEKNQDVSDFILDDLHIAYPTEKLKYKPLYFWKYNTNNILVREEIKNMFHDKFVICSKSFSKNNLFINNNLEYIDGILSG